MSELNSIKEIAPARLRAIAILERLATMLGNEDLFDSNWFDFEDEVTSIIEDEADA